MSGRKPDRIRTTFERLKRQGRTGLIPYVTAGDPNPQATEHVLDALVAAGCDLIELGVPFSDPMADGPAIQEAMGRALHAGTRFAHVLEMVRGFRARHPDVPLILFGYLNPLYQRGLERVCREAAEAGADGLLVVDLPPEEAPELTTHTRANALDFIALFTPTSDEARIAEIGANASGFAYYVSMTGVTGGAVTGGGTDLDALGERIDEVRRLTGLPVAVGFGVRTPEDARRLSQYADAVIVGSALIRAMAEGLPVEAPAIAGEFMATLRQALDADVAA